MTISAVLLMSTIAIVQKRADSVGLYDEATAKPVATITVGVKPHEMALTADGRELFVTNYGLDTWTSTDPGGHTISVIDLASRKVIATIDTGKYHRPHGIERGASGKFYVSTEVPAGIHVIDPAKRTILRNIDTPGKLPHMLLVTPDEKRAYLANAGSGEIVAVDLVTGRTLAQIEVGGVPMGLALDGDRLYATTRSANVLAVIDTRGLKVVNKIPLTGEPARVRLVGKNLLVTLIASGELAVIDPATSREVRRLPIGDHAEGIGVAPDGSAVYVSAQGEDRVVKLSTGDWKKVQEFKTGARPDPVIVLP